MLPKILIKPTSIEINDYNVGDSRKLEYNFSIYDPLYHTTYFKGIDYDIDRKVLFLPRGIDIDYIERVFNSRAQVVKPNPYMENNTPTMIKYLPRDEKQKEALKFLLGLEGYKNTLSKSQLKINLNTGDGKTYIAIAYIAYMNIKAMIIANTTDLLQQWHDKILEYTDIDPSEIYTVVGSASIKRLFNKSNVGKYKIILASHDTIKSYGDANGWNNIYNLFTHLNIGIKIYDEAHFNFDNMMKIDFNSSVFKTIYLTATPNRSDEKEDRIYQLAFKNVPAIDLFDRERDCRTKYIGFHFNSHPSPQQIQKCKNQYGFDRTAYIDYVVDTEEFHNLLHVLMPIIRGTCGKVLIYIGINRALLKVRDFLLDNYPDLCNQIGVYTSINYNKEDDKNKKIILSNTKSCGTGIDIKGLALTIVLAEPFKSKVLARQSLGRTRDRDTTYIDIVDDGFYYTNMYYNLKKPVFNKYATECINIQNDQDSINERAEKYRSKYINSIKPMFFVSGKKMIQAMTILPSDEDAKK